MKTPSAGPDTRWFAAAAAILVALYFMWPASAPAPRPGTGYFEVKERPLRVTIPLHGVIEARERFEISSPFSGVIEYMRNEGDFVKKGETIARLETTDLKNRLDELLLQKRQIDIDLQIGLEDHDMKSFERRNRKLYEVINKKRDEIQYNQMKYGIDFTKKLEYEYSIENAEIEIRSMEAELAEKEKLKKSGFISDTEISDLKNKIYGKKRSREITVRSLTKLLAGKDFKALADKEAEIRSDSLSVELASSAYEIYVKSRHGVKGRVQTRIENVTRDIRLTRESLDEADIKAPIDGIIIYGKTWITEGQEEKVKVGLNVFEGWPFMSVSALDEMNIAFMVNEVDISRITKGMKAEFRLASNPEKLLSAEIIDIGNVATVSENDANSICNIPVKARIFGDAAKLNLKPGMSVNAAIIVRDIEKAVVIPKEALMSGNVVRMAGGGLRRVETGASTPFECEIRKGLSPGERIEYESARAQTSRFDATEEHRVEKGVISNVISEIGELVPENKTNISVPFSGKINKIAEEGTEVAKGYEIAVIDVKEKSDKLMEKELRAKVLQKERKLIEERAGSEIRQLENALTVKDMDMKLAALDYEILIAPMKAETEKDFQLAIKLCENSLRGVENEYRLKSEMAKKGYASQSELQKVEIRLNKAKADLAIAKYKYDYDRSLPLPNNVKKAQLELEKTSLDRELNELRLSKRRKKFDMDMEKNEIENKYNKSQLEELTKFVERAAVKAPIGGTVIYVKKWSNEGLRKIKEGDITRDRMTFMELANLDRFYVSGSVPEEQFQRIAPGQAVEFYLPAAPDARFAGKIRKIGLFAREKEDGANIFRRRGDVPTEASKFFDVEIASEARSPKFQPGVSVNFEIVIDSRKDAVKLPRKFLFRDAAGYYVTLAGGYIRRVTIGIKSASEVEVTSGLSGGETVVR